jgi:stearoyl-CoA desaturase (Delta-9 desaturase)
VASNERLIEQFREWCAAAEASGVRALQDFAASLRGYSLRPA